MSKRSIVITGGFGTLGTAVASALIEAGATVTRVDYASAPATPLDGATEIGGTDLTDPAAAAEVIEKVKATHGGIDVLVNIAGGFAWETLAEGSLDTWKRMFDMNVLTTATITKAALDALRERDEARIINIGAVGALKADMGMGAYGASKSGVHRLTEALAAELAGSSVTVNAVLPTIIDTEPNRKDMPDADFSQWVKPAAIAKVVEFLASPDSMAVNGALIPVSRGASPT